MLISSGIEAENRQKAMDLIQIEMDKMVTGLFDDDDVKMAKDSLSSAVRSITDYPNSFYEFFTTHKKMSGKPFDMAGLLKKN